MSDEATLLAMFGRSPDDEDREYIRKSLLRFKGEPDASNDYLKKVAGLINKGEQLGHPTRETVIDALDGNGLDARKAQLQLRESYQKKRDAELKEEYRKNKEEAAKKATAP